METTIDNSNKTLDSTSNHFESNSESYFHISKEIERSVYAALETYSNVHRGSGHFSFVSTELFEKSREIVFEYLHLKKDSHEVLFLTPARADKFIKQLKSGTYLLVTSIQYGLPFGVVAVAVEKRYLPTGVPFESGGGTTKLISRDWVLWDKSPDKFEAGTPAIINIIAFARALQLLSMPNKMFSVNEDVPTIKTAKEILYNDDLLEFTGKELLDQLRKSLICQPQVPTMKGLKSYINFDNSASTPTFKCIWETVKTTWLMPNKIQVGIVEEVRNICSKALGVSRDLYDIIFTSNTTESINLVANYLDSLRDETNNSIILSSLLEHSSNDLPWRNLKGWILKRINVSEEGFFNLSELDNVLKSYNQLNSFGEQRIKVVALTGASNVLGSCNDQKEICRICHSYGAKVLIDGAQLTAHRSISIEDLGIDFYTFSAHKIYAPFGTGVLVTRRGLLNINTHDMHVIKASGEENSGGIAALGKALLLLQKVGMEIISEEEKSLNIYALKRMNTIQGIKIYGVKDGESPLLNDKLGVIAFSAGNKPPFKVAKELAIRGGIGIRAGCHCAHLTVKRILKIPHYVERIQWLILKAAPKLKLPGVLRVSFGIENNTMEVDEFIDVMTDILKNGNSNKITSPQNSKYKVSVEDINLQIKKYIEDAIIRVFSSVTP